MKRILVVDDEQDMCEIIRYNLEMEGYEVDTVNSGEAAWERLATAGMEPYNLVLLDVMMAGMSGFRLAQKMRDTQALAAVPIIFLTALSQESDVVKGLNIGADDYMSKPFSTRELVARVKAVLRRAAPQADAAAGDVLAYQSLVIDKSSKTVMVDGSRVGVTRLEFDLLCLLVENSPKVFSREEILHAIWPQDSYVLDRTVDVNITRVRRKIGRYGQHIKTKVGFGYTFEK